MIKKQFITDNQLDETFYYVAALNTMGVIYMTGKRYDNAEEVFKQIFAIDENFQLARYNYNVLQQLKQQAAGE